MLCHPGEILVLVGGVYHHKVVVVVYFVDDQVVHRATVFVAHGAVAGFSVLHDRVVVGQQVVQVGHRVGALHQDLAHVGDIKQAAGCANRHVLLDHARLILDRQNVSAEFHHFSSAFYVFVVQRGFLSIHSVCFLSGSQKVKGNRQSATLLAGNQ